MRFFCITKPRLVEINEALERACRACDIGYVPAGVGCAWRPFAAPPEPGDLIYRAAADLAAERVEALLLGPGIASFHRARAARAERLFDFGGTR